jgi:putative endonuclease
MTATVYIHYSCEADKYYIGSTTDKVSERLRRHLSNHGGFTSRAKDWTLVFQRSSIQTEALKREKELKGWKNRIRIEELINKPE